MGNIVGVQVPAHGGDEAVADPQPETAALAGSFGREERIEEVRQSCRRNATAGVGDHYCHFLARAGADCDLADCDLNVSRPVGPVAPARDDRVVRVGEKIEDDLFQVDRLTMCPGFVRRAVELDRNAFLDVLPTRHLDCHPDAADESKSCAASPSRRVKTRI